MNIHVYYIHEEMNYAEVNKCTIYTKYIRKQEKGYMCTYLSLFSYMFEVLFKKKWVSSLCRVLAKPIIHCSMTLLGR